MSDTFIALNDPFFVAPQISLGDTTQAKDAGVTLIVNNRPDGESPGQPASDEMAKAAADAGLAYVHIPVDGRGLSMGHISALKNALEENGAGKALAYCRSGTRSVILHAYWQATEGRAPAEIIAEAGAAGYDIRAHAQALQSLNSAA